jgi:hypothetical protein
VSIGGQDWVPGSVGAWTLPQRALVLTGHPSPALGGRSVTPLLGGLLSSLAHSYLAGHIPQRE